AFFPAFRPALFSALLEAGGAPRGEAFLVGHLLQLLQLAHSRPRRGGGRLRSCRGGFIHQRKLPAIEALDFVSPDDLGRGGGHYRYSSPLLPSASLPSSARRLAMARISFCATSTSLTRTGPRVSRSSSSISPARLERFLTILSRRAVSAPLSATTRVSVVTSRSSSWMPRSSISFRSSKTNIISWMRCDSSLSCSLILSMIALSMLESRWLSMLAAACGPPREEDFSRCLPAN